MSIHRKIKTSFYVSKYHRWLQRDYFAFCVVSSLRKPLLAIFTITYSLNLNVHIIFKIFCVSYLYVITAEA